MKMKGYTPFLHGKNNFPFRKQVSDWDIEFENDTGDEDYLNTFGSSFTKIIQKNST